MVAFPKEVYFFAAIRISKQRLPPLLSTTLSLMKQNFCFQGLIEQDLLGSVLSAVEDSDKEGILPYQNMYTMEQKLTLKKRNYIIQYVQYIEAYVFSV